MKCYELLWYDHCWPSLIISLRARIGLDAARIHLFAAKLPVFKIAGEGTYLGYNYISHQSSYLKGRYMVDIDIYWAITKIKYNQIWLYLYYQHLWFSNQPVWCFTGYSYGRLRKPSGNEAPVVAVPHFGANVRVAGRHSLRKTLNSRGVQAWCLICVGNMTVPHEAMRVSRDPGPISPTARDMRKL